MNPGNGENMTMIIDPTGGIAGDMFVAALISAGADPEHMKTVMLSAAKKLGAADLTIKKTRDGCMQFQMKLHTLEHHLGENEAIAYLNELFGEFNITKEYQCFGKKILSILFQAEKKAHADHDIMISHSTVKHHHSIDHSLQNQFNHQSTGTVLHEAQDIIIDIMGAVMGLQILEIEPQARLSNPVSVGGGTIDFSHGLFNVPAPATKIILESHNIPWKRGPIAKELCTPTGAAIMAALGVTLDPSKTSYTTQYFQKGKSRGSYLYNIPAFKIYIN
jgi:uncharacterized protein (DUF111 family)